MSKDEADQAEAEAKDSDAIDEAADDEAEASDAAAASVDDDESDDDESDDDESDDDESDDDESDDDESDDDESDDDESDDEESDDDESDDDESDDDESDDAPALKRTGKGKKKRRGGMTPGERLAAAKARKAKKKSDKRGRQAEVVEDRVLKQAGAATDWLAENRQMLWIAAAAVLVLIGGGVFWSMNATAKAAEASDALWEAVQAANGEIRSEGNVAGDQDEDSEIFDSREARAETTLERAEQVRSDYPGTPAAIWAALEAGTALLDLERWGDAREFFQTAISEGGREDAVTWRALEGLAFSYEGEQKWDDAIQRFNELKTSGDGAFEEVADYHLARMHIAKGESDEAKEILAGLLDALREREETGPELDFIRSQTEIRLLELDSSLLPSSSPSGGAANPFGGAGGSDPFENIPPELREQLMEQLRQQGAAGGAGGAGGE